MEIIYEEQKKYDDLKVLRRLPYDFYLPQQNILVELQGIQHCSINYFRSHNNLDKFLKRIYHDNLKSLYAFKNNINFLSISYYCLNSIPTILENFIKDNKMNKLLFRYHITEDIYLEYKIDLNNNITYNSINNLSNNEILFYQYFLYNLETLLNKRQIKPKKDELIFCYCCKEYYTSYGFNLHVYTEEHENKMIETKEQLGLNLFGFTTDGVPIIIEE